MKFKDISPWNDLVDEQVLEILGKPDTTTDKVHSLLASLAGRGLITGYVKDDVPSVAINEPLLSASKLSCPCKMMEEGDAEHFILRIVVNSKTSHCAWLILNSKWCHAPFVLAYADQVRVSACCEHIRTSIFPAREIVSDEEFKPLERVGKPGFILEEDYRSVALMLAPWVLDEEKDAGWKGRSPSP
ncbi:MAG: hypothetical protein AB7F75_01160 [Planctomycetota bacterium]